MLVKTMEGPQKTPSSRVTPLYTDTLFWILQLLPMLTSGPMTTFWPMLQRSPIFEPGQHMGEMPDFRSGSDHGARIDDGRRRCTNAPAVTASGLERPVGVAESFGRRQASFFPSSRIRLPCWSIACLLAFRTLNTRSPSFPSVAGCSPFTMQLRKCWHSRLSGSSRDISTAPACAFTGTGMLLCHSMLVRENQELFRPMQGVVEHGHFAVADYHQFLLLEWVQPGHENVGLEPAGNSKWVVVTSAMR